MKRYKRINRTIFSYSLFDAEDNVYDLIENDNNFEKTDYYESIYYYPEDVYINHIDGLKKACEYYDIKFDEQDRIKTFSRVWKPLKKDWLNKDDLDEDIQVIITNLYDNISVSQNSDVVTDKLVFDFDCKSDIDLAREDTLTTIDRLSVDGIDDVEIYFSGGKGFHLIVNLNNYINKDEFIQAVDYYAGDLKYFDKRVREEQRVFRVPLTYNKGFYKIPLTLDEIQNSKLSEIKNKAKEYNTDEILDLFDKYCDTKRYTLRDDIFKSELEKELFDPEPENIEPSDKININLSLKPKWLTAEKYALQEGWFGFEQGERNHAFMILASTYKNNGFSSDIAFNMLKAVAKIQAKRSGRDEYSEDKIRREIIEQVYSPAWKGGMYSYENSDLLQRLTKELGLQEDTTKSYNFSILETIDRFKENAKNKEIIKLGIPSVDKKLQIFNGDLVTLFGASGCGKTTIVTEFIKNFSSIGENVIFHSMDMSQDQLISRLIQKYQTYQLSEIYRRLKHDPNDDELFQIFEKIREDFSNVFFNYRKNLGADDIEENLSRVCDKLGKKPKLMVIDYFGQLNFGNKKDTTAAEADMMRRLSAISQEQDILVILLVQPTKLAGNCWQELTKTDIKGSGLIYEVSRNVIGIWRPGSRSGDIKTGNDKYMRFGVIKSNNTGEFQIDLGWDGASGQIHELSDDEIIQLANLEMDIKQRDGQYGGFKPFTPAKRWNNGH